MRPAFSRSRSRSCSRTSALTHPLGDRYEPGYAHPVFQTFLPPELAGTTFLRADADLEGKTVDEAALREWEWRARGGARWEGREELERRVRERDEREAARTKGEGEKGGSRARGEAQ